MSTLSVSTITDASGGNTATINSYTPTESNMAGRNRIINGDMRIDQRNAGASVTPNVSYTLDRWIYENTQTGKATVQQNAGSVTPPTGFTNYLGVTSSSAYSVLTGDTFLLGQRIEGYNVADFAWGTANAQTVTLSFWVRSSLTGTFGGALQNVNATRSYPFTYAISAANTWEKKTVTISGDTSGTWNTGNGRGLYVMFGLGSGATYSGTDGAWATGNLVQPTSTVSVVGTSGATFYITGVQLEAGSVATPFERRQYGQELALCQRYCQVFSSTNGQYDYFASGAFYNSTQGRFFKPLLVPMRTSPTFTSAGTLHVDSVSYISLSSISLESAEPQSVRLGFTASSAGSNATGYGCFLSSSTSSTEKLTLEAEL